MSTESFYLCQYHALFQENFQKKRAEGKGIEELLFENFFPSFIRDIIDTQNM